mgnify:CR=1 FL=1
MAGIVGLTELQHTSGNSAMTITTSGDVNVKGEGTATTNLRQGLAKNWCSFDGTAGSLSFEDSFNSSTLVDNGTGNYSVNFTNAMSNAFFSCHGSCFATRYTNTESRTTARYRIRIADTSASASDREGTQGVAHGDLA